MEARAERLNKNRDIHFEGNALNGPEMKMPKNIAGRKILAARKSFHPSQPVTPMPMSPKTEPEKKKAFSVGLTVSGGRS